jgi:Fe-S-cluster containining protein
VTTPAVTRKEAIWLACKKKSCCYSAVVVPSGRDVWRIARTLDNPPWAFCVYFRAPGPRGDAFILDRSGMAFHLALAKQPSRRTKTPPPCIFLLKTRDGAHLCGLGALRPQTCKTFPSEVVGGVVCMRPDSGCTCRRWLLNDVDIAEETAALDVRDADFAEYCKVVARWNAEVAAAPPDATFTFFDYCNYVLEAYDAIAADAEPVAAR